MGMPISRLLSACTSRLELSMSRPHHRTWRRPSGVACSLRGRRRPSEPQASKFRQVLDTLTVAPYSGKPPLSVATK